MGLGASWRSLGGFGCKVGVGHRFVRFPFSGSDVFEASWGALGVSWGVFWRVLGVLGDQGAFQVDTAVDDAWSANSV